MKGIDLTKIKNIIFDLGIVLLDLDFEASKKKFQALGLDDLDAFYSFFHANPFFHDFETGHISETEFIKGLKKLITKPSAETEILEAWNSIISGFPAKKIEFIKTVSQFYNIYMLSNTNSLHAKKYEQQFYETAGDSIYLYFKKIYYSHNIGYRKPDKKAFLTIINENSLIPEETLFIDDLEQNLVTAKEMKMKTYLYKPDNDLFTIFNLN